MIWQFFSARNIGLINSCFFFRRDRNAQATVHQTRTVRRDTPVCQTPVATRAAARHRTITIGRKARRPSTPSPRMTGSPLRSHKEMVATNQAKAETGTELRLPRCQILIYDSSFKSTKRNNFLESRFYLLINGFINDTELQLLCHVHLITQILNRVQYIFKIFYDYNNKCNVDRRLYDLLYPITIQFVSSWPNILGKYYETTIIIRVFCD